MLTRKIGTLEVSAVGVGCNNFGWSIFDGALDEAATGRVVHAAIDAGVNFFDTAESYGESEVFLGRALRDCRHRAVIATKVSSARPDDIPLAVDRSLRRLDTDCVDLYQLHRPDPTVPIEETLGALQAAVQAGKVREIGCSNASADYLRVARAAASHGVGFVSVQNELNLLRRTAATDVIPECARLGIAFLPYFPLASGLLTGKYRSGQPAPAGTRLASGPMARQFNAAALETVDPLITFAESRGHTLLELAFAWLLSLPAVASVIAGVTSVDQLRANAATTTWQLTPAESADLQALLDRA